MADQKCECPDAGNAVNVPITGITLPFCGFGVNIDASKLPKCECGLSREELLAMLDALTGEFDKKLAGIGEKLVIVDEKLAACGYALCEFYLFRHPALKKGFERAEGGLLENAAALYPEAWAYLQTPEGQKLCKTEAEWQAMTRATWATLADGTKVGWDGIGGAPFYAPDLSTGALRLPDLRGMYAEAAGFDSLGVGGVHGDGVRDIPGRLGMSFASFSNLELENRVTDGAFELSRASVTATATGSNVNMYTEARMRISRVSPVANKNQPRAWGSLACVYLGLPQ